MAHRVVQMTSVHTPFDARIYYKECRSLAMAGYDVTLIAPHSGGDQTDDGIKLRAVGLPRERRERMTKTIPDVYHAAADADAEVYHFHDPELMPVGMLLKLRGKKVIYDVHEDYASNMRKQWIPVALQAAASMAVKVSETTMGSLCDRIVAATPKIAGHFRPGMTRVVQNFPWKEEFNALPGAPYRERDPIVAYVGYLADVRGLREMIESIRLVNAEMHARLILAGKMVIGAQAETVEGSEHLDVLGAVDRTQVAEVLSRARVGICVYHPTANYFHGQPTKLLEYMGAGLPVVGSDFPFYREVVGSTGCGLLVDPLKPAEISEAILWLLRNPERAEEMGRCGQRAVLDRYNWEQESKTLLAVYHALLS